MFGLLRAHRRWFAAWTVVALGLRLFFYFWRPGISGDALYYGELAKNLLRHGVYGASDATGVHSTLARMPGYPAFLAAIWAVAGVEHYHAVLLTQIVISTFTCFVIADLARRLLPLNSVVAKDSGTPADPRRAVKFAFALAAACPFTANYAACALTETLAIFLTAMALDLAVLALDSERMAHWAGCGAAIAAGILVRPDAGILLPVIGLYPLAGIFVRPGRRARNFWAGAVLSSVSLAPLAPWSIRNWREFHVFQPLAPPTATMPGEYLAPDFSRWVKTWIADYASTAEILFPIGEEEVDYHKLPARAFDTPDERARTAEAFAEYNDDPDHSITPKIDAKFASLADERIRRHPLRYYVWLPALRTLDIWLRPRTEMIGVNDRWWEVVDDPGGTSIAIALGLINLFYVCAAVAAGSMSIWRWMRRGRRIGEAEAGGLGHAPRYLPLLLGFVFARSLFFGWALYNPEQRYTLEMYPVLIVLAAEALRRLAQRRITHAQRRITHAELRAEMLR